MWQALPICSRSDTICSAKNAHYYNTTTCKTRYTWYKRTNPLHTATLLSRLMSANIANGAPCRSPYGSRPPQPGQSGPFERWRKTVDVLHGTRVSFRDTHNRNRLVPAYFKQM